MNEKLHRKHYERHFGNIPKGFDVHHIDGNHNNNDPRNLLLVTEEMHRWLHTQTVNPWMSTINWRELASELRE
jgi:hypothetical protein